jgi:hypothetical protein
MAAALTACFLVQGIRAAAVLRRDGDDARRSARPRGALVPCQHLLLHRASQSPRAAPAARGPPAHRTAPQAGAGLPGCHSEQAVCLGAPDTGRLYCRMQVARSRSVMHVYSVRWPAYTDDELRPLFALAGTVGASQYYVKAETLALKHNATGARPLSGPPTKRSVWLRSPFSHADAAHRQTGQRTVRHYVCADTNKDGVIDRRQAAALLLAADAEADVHSVTALVDKLDPLGSGAIDYASLHRVLGVGPMGQPGSPSAPQLVPLATRASGDADGIRTHTRDASLELGEVRRRSMQAICLQLACVSAVDRSCAKRAARDCAADRAARGERPVDELTAAATDLYEASRRHCVVRAAALRCGPQGHSP